ncbi:MAG: HTTM domain-containing protein [Saprospiraceae bacterium]|nr:HTTM domain-containing protein [Saprospiraceae bacterium]
MGKLGYRSLDQKVSYQFPSTAKRLLLFPLLIYVIFQICFPLRYLCYPDKVQWTEQGYRFAWRVMLVEKNGQATFKVQDAASNRQSEIINSHYLTPYQEKTNVNSA